MFSLPFGLFLIVAVQDNLDLVDLPLSYTELYGLAKSPHASAAAAEGAATGNETDPAVCLVCGQVCGCGCGCFCFCC